MRPSFEALNRALSRWDAAKWRIWTAAGRTAFDPVPDWAYHRIKAALATIGRCGWGADDSVADLELFVPRPLIVYAMDKAEVVRKSFSAARVMLCSCATKQNARNWRKVRWVCNIRLIVRPFEGLNQDRPAGRSPGQAMDVPWTWLWPAPGSLGLHAGRFGNAGVAAGQIVQTLLCRCPVRPS